MVAHILEQAKCQTKKLLKIPGLNSQTMQSRMFPYKPSLISLVYSHRFLIPTEDLLK